MSRKPTKSKGALREWRITRIGAKGQYLGHVEAPDEAGVINVAIEQFGIRDPEQQRRLIAHQIGE